MKDIPTSNRLSLTEGPILKTLLVFSIPFLAANVLQVAYGTVDMIIIGMYSTQVSDTSAISNASHIVHVIVYAISSFTTGGTVLIGQYMGANRINDVRLTICTMIGFFSLFGTLVSTFVLCFSESIVHLMRIPEAAVSASVAYLRICGGGIIFSTAYQMFGSIMRGLGDSRSPMEFIAVSCVINIALDFLFIGTFRLGVIGAAWATVVAQGLSVLFSIVQLRKKHHFFFNPKSILDFIPNRQTVRQLVKIGLPMSIDMTVVNVSFLIINALINMHGVVASAVIGINEKIGSITRLPASSIANAVTAMVAQNIGAGNEQRARRTLWCSIALSLSLCAIPFMLMQVTPRSLMGLYTSDTETITAGLEYMQSFSLDTLLVCLTFNMASFFSGCKKPMFTLLRNLVSTLLVRIPSAILFANVLPFSFFNIGMSPGMASVMSFIICALYYKWGRYIPLDERKS